MDKVDIIQYTVLQAENHQVLPAEGQGWYYWAYY